MVMPPSDAPNVFLRQSFRKAYLARKNQRVIETILKIDPTKPHFFKDMNDIKVDLDVIVRNAEAPQDRAAGRRVHYAANTIGVSTQSNGNDFDEERDDEGDYAAYQSTPHYTGYDGHAASREEHLAGLLLQ